jgi:hypothetical protein
MTAGDRGRCSAMLSGEMIRGNMRLPDDAAHRLGPPTVACGQEHLCLQNWHGIIGDGCNVPGSLRKGKDDAI